MIIFSYNLILFLTYPIIALIGIFRIFLKKENYLSFNQKFFANHNYKEFKNLDTIIHFASIGELNSIQFLLEKLNNEKILLTCSTLSSYNLAQKKYPNIKVIFLPIDFKWNVKKFISRINVTRILWIDSEIWPNWLIHSKNSNIKNILVNGRLSKKSYSKWIKLRSFSKSLGEKYELILAKSLEDKDKLYEVFQNKVYFFGNLKFYLDVKISKEKYRKNNLCFASIHKSEFVLVKAIINRLNLELFDSITIIPRHIKFSNELSSILGLDLGLKFNREFLNKIKVHDKFGESLPIFDKSKLVFMGGSLIDHGGQNPLEPLSRGSYIISGKNIDNFKDQYLDLEKLNLAKVLDNNLNEISTKINHLITLNFDDSKKIYAYFEDNSKYFNKMIEMIEKC